MIIEYEIVNFEMDGDIQQPPSTQNYTNRLIILEELEDGYKAVLTMDHPVKRELYQSFEVEDLQSEYIAPLVPDLEIELFVNSENGEFEILNTEELARDMESFFDKLGALIEERNSLFKALFDLSGLGLESFAFAEEIIEIVEDDMMYILLPFRHTFRMDRPVTVVEKEQNPLDYSTISVKTVKYEIEASDRKGVYRILEETDIDLSAFTETMSQMKSLMQDNEEDDKEREDFSVLAGFHSDGVTVFDAQAGWVERVELETHVYIRSELMGSFENRSTLSIRVRKQ